ncbi:hypothetical protein M0R45_015249 [Rubus argutus]|uniref:Calcium-transporting P-type ATPase N-terminal autoinhibitory domain-containing protein n=1 Tax=Rubus argutus TaxID=59490 RepID=A0AAW1XRH7_RUBAR
MDSDMRENFIGVEKPMDSETATQRWRKLCSFVKNHKQSFRLTAKLSMHYEEQAPAIRSSHQKTFRVVVFSIQAALELVDALHSRGKEQTERREEVNNMLAIPLESEPSAIDSDGHGARVIPPSNHPVDDTNGSALNRSPLHSTGSHYYNQTHQAPGHDDSNPTLSLLPSGGSDPALTSNNVPGLVVSYDSRMERGNLSRSSDANVVPDQPHRATGVTTSFWIFSATGLGFEAVSAFFDQVSSPQKPHYALYGMLLSVVAILVCILDLIHNAIKQREAASGSDMLWGILPEVFGLALACVQCISSALQFSFICRHAANPVKVSPVPFLFCFVLFAFKYRNGRN